MASQIRSNLQQINILLVGKSGTGKSTFINSFSNFVAYKKLDDITSKSVLKVPIPAIFSFKNSSGEETSVIVGNKEDGNESLKLSASGTTGCRSYTYKFKDLVVNLIDSAGLGDTKGVEQDKKNVESVLNFISQFETLNAICVVLPTKENRLDPLLRYCITALLSQLDSGSASNLIFLLTSASDTKYKAGSTKTTMIELLEEIKKGNNAIMFKPMEQATFLVENDWFSFAALRNLQNYDEDEVDDYHKSWRKSREACFQLLQYIRALPKHKVDESVAVYKARKVLESVIRISKDITEEILKRETELKKNMKLVMDGSLAIEQLQENLYVESKVAVTETQNDWAQVCKARSCQTYPEMGGIHYKVCQSNANDLADTQTKIRWGTLGIGLISEVIAFNTFMICDSCGHKYSEHEVTKTITRIKHVVHQFPGMKERLSKEQTEIGKRRQAVECLKEGIKNLSITLNQFASANGKFAVFLKNKAVVTYNDSYLEYIKMKIEADRVSRGSSEDSKSSLQKALEQYIEVRDTFEMAVQESEEEGKGGNLELDKITEEIKLLCEVPTYGAGIQALIDNIHEGQHEGHEGASYFQEINISFASMQAK